MTSTKKPRQNIEISSVADRRAIPPFASLRAFEAVGRVGGIRKAALELSIDHAVVSRHLRALEAWLGIALFDRNSATPSLNATGRQYHKVISATMRDIARATRDIVGSESGSRLLIWCVPGFASRWLAANLDHFAMLHPRIEVELRPTDISPDFSCDEADGDIRFVRDISNLSPPRGVDWLTFARPKVFPVATGKWIVENAASHPMPADFLNLKLLHEENDEEWRGWFTANSVVVGTRIAGPRLWHAHLTLAAAIRGQGVCLANPFLIVNDVADGRLQIMTTPDHRPVDAEIGAYVFSCRNDAMERPAMRKFREWIVARATDFLQNEAPSLLEESRRVNRQSSVSAA